MIYEMPALSGPDDGYEKFGRGKTRGPQPATLETEGTCDEITADFTPHSSSAMPPHKTTLTHDTSCRPSDVETPKKCES